ncbi:ubiquitin fusion degradation protein (Ufd1) [Purpureocillium lavendulum]|uniref:Ubiquitin fusion degradation protein (Ufd1) n=1 Tax=Purpureocillium lavendulum TaxID=1247861 RepID=A0AB34FL31_9HYPO|nr:ubiquitin fusion degradation protein (Ufd1) [Purpureocillium lavendulum]
MSELEKPSSSLNLFDILHNSLILRNTVPHLAVSSILNLAATDRSFRALINQTPGVFRHLDLTRVKTAQFDIDEIDHGGQVWRNVQLDENLTEDDFYSGPLRGVFSTLKRRNILQDVQTLILDGLSVTAELCYDIINDPSFNVRILSVRDVRNLNQGKLRGALQYACRSSRPDNTPRLKALYVFGSRDAALTDAVSSGTSTASHHRHNDHHHGASISAGWNHKSQVALTSALRREGDAWWSKKGIIISRPISSEWVNCMVACEGLIAFDTVLCRGPRHRNSPAFGKTPSPLRVDSNEPAIATYAVSGCESCGKAPEGVHRPHASQPMSLPLLAPPPLVSSSIRAATSPHHHQGTVGMPGEELSFVARCLDCLRERYCAGCHKWWCEDCYQLPGQYAMVETEVNNVVVVEPDDGENDAAVSVSESLQTIAISANPKIKAITGMANGMQCNLDWPLGDTRRHVLPAKDTESQDLD